MILWLLKYFRKPTGPLGPGGRGQPELCLVKTHYCMGVESFFNGHTTLNIIERGRTQSVGFTGKEYKSVSCKLFWGCCCSRRLYERHKSTYSYTVHIYCMQTDFTEPKLLWPLTSLSLLGFLFILQNLLINIGVMSLLPYLPKAITLLFCHLFSTKSFSSLTD